MVTIAHYRRGNTLLRMLIFFLMVVVISAFSIAAHEGQSIQQQLAAHPLTAALFFVGLFGMLFGVGVMFLVVKRILIDGGRALWIDDGVLIFLHRWNISVRLADVLGMSDGNFGRFNRRGVRFRLKHGREKTIPMDAFSEPAEQIISQIRENLAISGGAIA
jgi:hypothetical protein